MQYFVVPEGEVMVRVFLSAQTGGNLWLGETYIHTGRTGVPAPFPHQLTTPATVQCRDTTYTVKHGTSPRAPQTLPPLTSAYNFTATYALESSVRYSGIISGGGYAYKTVDFGSGLPRYTGTLTTQSAICEPSSQSYAHQLPLDLSYDGQPEAILPNPPSLPAPVVHSRGGKGSVQDLECQSQCTSHAVALGQIDDERGS